MSTVASSSDIFLSFAPQDAAIAETAKQAFTDQGLAVYVVSSLDRDADIFRSLREALVASRAVNVILSRGLELPASTVVELGAAMAWPKPVFVLIDDVEPAAVPNYLREFRLFPMSRLADVVAMVRRSADALSDAERNGLIELYRTVKVPADELLTDPLALDQLTCEFNQRFGQSRSPERLARELLKLRKSLPTITRRKPS